MDMEHAVRFARFTPLCVVFVMLAAACTGGSSPPSSGATASPTREQIQMTLAKAQEGLLDADSAQIAMSVEISVDEQTTDFAADLAYVAPSSLFGTVTVADGSIVVRADNDRLFAENRDGSWLQLNPFLTSVASRVYGGGLVDISQLSGYLFDADAEDDGNIEKIHGTLGGIGFNAYLERLIEPAVFNGLVGYLARSTNIWVDRRSGLPTHVEVSGSTASPSDGAFSVRMDFSHYNKPIKALPVPSAITPYSDPRIAGILTPTVGPARGCAAGVHVTPVDSPVGRLYRAGDHLSVTLQFTAPGCKFASAEFDGEYEAGSPRYKQVCHKQCGSSISAVFGSPEVPLSAGSGSVVIEAASGFPPVPLDPTSSDVEGFRVCAVNVTFNDGVIGGTFDNIRLGTPSADPPTGSACD
jgi:hypothetical protein